MMRGRGMAMLAAALALSPVFGAASLRSAGQPVERLAYTGRPSTGRSPARERRAARKYRNQLRARGQHRKAVR